MNCLHEALQEVSELIVNRPPVLLLAAVQGGMKLDINCSQDLKSPVQLISVTSQ